ncbi:MAG: M48 family peptidase [Sedimenticola sp.]|nr:MAG: M48 family peptidase [Sedimenticola sp.]
MKEFTDRVRWGNTHIPYRYRYTKRKTLGISVHPDLTVTVKAPEGTSPEAIRAKVRQRVAWIRKAWREFELYLPKQPDRRYVSGETHRYLGRQYRLKVFEGPENSVKCLRGYFWVITTDRTPTAVQQLLETWYRDHARNIFRGRLDACYRLAARENIPEPMLRIQKMTNRWGSCSDKGRILLNLELIKATRDCIDYVITHELCHLKEKHHGPRFWKLLEKLMPDFEQRRKKLNLFADV